MAVSTERLAWIDAAAKECADRVLVGEGERAFAEIIERHASKEMEAQPPNCPKCGTRMVKASGKEHYHDLKHPHYRCELWVGSGVCGQTLPLNP